MDAAPLPRLNLIRLSLDLDGDGEVLYTMLELFLKCAHDNLRALDKAMQNDNVLLWHQQLHMLKGAALNVTAQRLTSLCAEAETITHLPHAHTEAMLYHLQKEIAYIRDEISGFTEAMPR